MKSSKWIVRDDRNIGDIAAGGDIIRGGATVILAMGDGRIAAAEIDKYLQNGKR